MSLDLNNVPSASKRDLGRVEDGTFAARIVNVVDIGIQHLTDWQTQKPKYHALDEEGKWAKNGNEFVFTDEPNEHPDEKPQVLLTFEFPTERVTINDESLPRWMSKEYTLSNHEKAGIVKLVGAISAGTTKLGDLRYTPCFVAVGSTGPGKAKIAGVSAPMKGMEVGALENEAVVFSMDTADLESFNKLPNFVQNKVKAAVNFKDSAISKALAAKVAEPAADVEPDESEVPF